jgi:hypothetical protein
VYLNHGREIKAVTLTVLDRSSSGRKKYCQEELFLVEEDLVLRGSSPASRMAIPCTDTSTTPPSQTTHEKSKLTIAYYGGEGGREGGREGEREGGREGRATLSHSSEGEAQGPEEGAGICTAQLMRKSSAGHTRCTHHTPHTKMMPLERTKRCNMDNRSTAAYCLLLTSPKSARRCRKSFWATLLAMEA